jgi:hypothetical protein
MQGAKVLSGLVTLVFLTIFLSAISHREATQGAAPTLGPSINNVLSAPALSNAGKYAESMRFEDRMLCRRNVCQEIIYAYSA